MLANTPTEPGVYWAKAKTNPLSQNILFNVLVALEGIYPCFGYKVYSIKNLNDLTRGNYAVHIDEITAWGPLLEQPLVKDAAS